MREAVDVLAFEPPKFCNVCLELLPADQFRRFKAGEPRRHPECNACHRNAEAERTAILRSKRTGKLAQRVHAARNQRELTSAVSRLIAAFGGINSFAIELSTHIKSAKPGSRAKAIGLHAIVRMVELVDKTQSATPDLSDVSDAELQRILDESTRRVLDEDFEDDGQ